jgi:iron complex transport system ATP-binding protein
VDAPLALEDVRAGYGRHEVLRGVSLALEPGKVVALVGPNGAGKSTLLRVASGALAPTAGRVRVAGRDLASLSAREAALHVSGVAQDESAGFGFTVRQTASIGRYARLGPFRSAGPADDAACDAAIDALGLTALADRPVSTLSGGERRRAALARCLAQEAPVLLLDEPTAHLDLGHEVRALRALRARARDGGRAVLAAIHDVNLAALFADRVVLLVDGVVVADAPPPVVLTEARLSAAFRASVRVTTNPDAPVPVVIPRDLPASGESGTRP